MAEKSLLSLRGEVNWVTGDYDNVINSTRRMVSTMNAGTSAELRAGQRERERILQGGLNEIERQEEAAAERLIQSKRNAAQEMAKAGEARRTPPPLPPDASSADIKKRQKEIDDLVATGERAHKRLQKVQESGGRAARAGTSATKGGMEAFAAGDAGQRAADIKDRERTIELVQEEIRENERLYQVELDGKRGNRKVAVDLRAEKARLNKELEEHQELKKEEVKLDRRLQGYDKEKIETDRKLGQARKKLGIIQQTTAQKTIQMEKELIMVNREAAEEIGRMRQELGEGLRSAFTYATVAITAFWYKLTPVVETFKEFEAELVNAQSIWQNSQQELNQLSDQVVQFGQEFGINMGKATEGLYQYASAGVEAADAMAMLNDTLQLSMAVQGDHNTLAKLTTQTIMGFGMEFDQASEVTDKFAHAINMSLIEWDDLASSIKFALPFFTSTGQSLDQLLGALSVLTNRALEAGIAGRGLRQALAEFTQHADDNSAAFAKMGVEILDAEGNMKQLTEIAAQFQSVMGDGVNDMDIMMALMEDLNIRGATAFVHLVQNADEFQAQVDDLQNSAGASARMAEIQQKSLVNQIQLVRNALQAPFLMSDKVGEAAGYTNEFAMTLHMMVKEFESLIVVEQNGTKQLTEFGEFIKNFVIEAMKELSSILVLVVDTIKSFGDQGEAATRMLHLFTVPLTLAIKLIKLFGPELLTTWMIYSKLTQILPLNTAALINNIQMRMLDIEATRGQIVEQMLRIDGLKAEQIEEIQKIGTTEMGTTAIWAQVAAMAAQKLALMGMIYFTQKLGQDSHAAAFGIGALAGAIMGVAVALQTGMITMQTKGWGFVGAAAAGALAMGTFNTLMYASMNQKPESFQGYSEPSGSGGWSSPEGRAYGGPVYPKMANGGSVTNTPYIVGEKGPELFIPHTSGTITPNDKLGSGITIHISGDVYDGDNFANKIQEVLPQVLRNTNDIGGI